MENVNESELKEVITNMVDGFDRKLFEKTNEQLEEYWYFKWDYTRSVHWNIYQFHDLLKLYGSLCRRWEEKHKGSCCVVERVRDKYLMPKIEWFYKVLLANNQQKEC